MGMKYINPRQICPVVTSFHALCKNRPMLGMTQVVLLQRY